VASRSPPRRRRSATTRRRDARDRPRCPAARAPGG
jgi:hypothetical protein